MNERIQKLAEQAGFFPTELTQVGPSVEKFAELLVGECVSVINAEAAEHEDDDEIERAWKMGTEFAVYQIKQHFGVKE